MARVSDNEKDALRQAADCARSILPKLQEQQETLAQRIASLESVIKAYELLSGQRKAKTEPAPGEHGKIGRKRSPKGQVAQHIDAVLQDGAELDERAIRDKIAEKFGVRYGRPTVYTALGRGYKQHKYSKNGTKWRISPLLAISKTA